MSSKLVAAFIVCVVLIGSVVFFFYKFKNRALDPSLRTDIASGPILSSDPNNASNVVRKLADTYKFDPLTNTGVTVFENEKDTVLINGFLDSYEDFVLQGKDGVINVQTTAGIVSILLNEQTIYSSINDTDTTLKSIKELHSIRAIEQGKRVHVKAVLGANKNFYAVYVEQRL